MATGVPVPDMLGILGGIVSIIEKNRESKIHIKHRKNEAENKREAERKSETERNREKQREPERSREKQRERERERQRERETERQKPGEKERRKGEREREREKKKRKQESQTTKISTVNAVCAESDFWGDPITKPAKKEMTRRSLQENRAAIAILNDGLGPNMF